MSDLSWTTPAVAAFVVIPVTLALAFTGGVWAAWRQTASARQAATAALLAAIATGVWMLLTWRLAASGVLRRWDAIPPPFGLLVVSILLLAFRLAFSSAGRRLAIGIPLWALVAIQAFRLPLEMAMHQMYVRGIMPVQMSYAGMNFDILTGMTAVLLAWLIFTRRAGYWLVFAWNVLGLLLLGNVVTIAILATPKFRFFGDGHLNVWVTYPPFVWLPAVMVLAALAGHLVIWRALRLQRPASRT